MHTGKRILFFKWFCVFFGFFFFFGIHFIFYKVYYPKSIGIITKIYIYINKKNKIVRLLIN